MLQKIHHKLQNKSGESLIETIVALMLGALALTMLAGAISASSNLITKSRKKMAEYNDTNEKVVNMENSIAQNGAVTINGGTLSGDIVTGVTFYTNAQFLKTPVIAYQQVED